MEELYVAQVDYKESRNLADLGSILQDLTFTLEICKRLIQLLKDDSKDVVLVASLWTAALICYVRSFASGKRYGLSEDIFNDLTGDAIEVHKFYKNLRDKHIAHSVSPYEQVEVGLILSPKDSGEKKVKGVATLSMRYICTTIEGVEQLGRLATVLRKEVARLAKECEGKVLEVGKNLPIDELYSRARIRTVAPGPEVSGRPRP